MGVVDDVFLDIGRSLSGRRWVQSLDAAGAEQARELAQSHGLSNLLGRLLIGRGIADVDVGDYLSPRLRHNFPDPSGLPDCDIAAERLGDALMRGDKILVFGDYDADGITATALMVRLLTQLDADVDYYIPDRAAGYGPNAALMEGFAADGVAVVVTVDCGSTAHDALLAAQRASMMVIIFDHHKLDTSRPVAAALVNPQCGGEAAFADLSAVGVSFVAAVGLLRYLRRRGWFSPARSEPDLRCYLDLVALGMVCDVMPLRGFNRTLIASGLRLLNRGGGNPGLQFISSEYCQGTINGHHLGFALGPRINAAGRMGAGNLGARLLLTDDIAEIKAIAERLDVLNSRRREIEQNIVTSALERMPRPPNAAIIVAGEGWHHGVVGIVASRLVDQFERPAIVIAFDAEGLGRGSGRSVAGFDLGAVIAAARREGLLQSGGGHAMAAGLTLRREHYDSFAAFVTRAASIAIKPREASALRVDASISIAALNHTLIEEIERLGPFGAGNPRPLFALPNVRLIAAQPVGVNHLRLIVNDMAGQSTMMMGFGIADRPLGRSLTRLAGQRIHCLGHAELNHWKGTTSIRLLLKDAAAVEHAID